LAEDVIVLPYLGVSGQGAIVAVWAGTCVQLSVKAKNGAILSGLWRRLAGSNHFRQRAR
jgi:hypothetical protein